MFSHLFTPVNIGKMTVKNRIAMAPMGTSFWSEDGLLTEQAKHYYEARAKGGAGLIIVENANVDFYRGMHASNRPTLDSDRALPGLAELSQTIKKHGARAVIQVNHPGRMAKSRIGGLQPVAPSSIPYPGGRTPEGELPRELTVPEIHEIVNLFARAAARAKRAGFEGIEVHAAHAYLIATFLSPVSNKRQDMYGGSLENRARILLEVLRAMRASVGSDYPLWCRINGQESGSPDALTAADACAVAGMFNSIVDAVHVSTYGFGRSSLASSPEIPGELIPLAAAIKKSVTVPVIAVGRLSPELGDQAIRDGKVDMVAMGKGLLVDPELSNKALAGRLEDIKPCIVCHWCQDMGVVKNSSISCAVNGAVGRESESQIKPARDARKIAIIGGGPAGLEAARVSALRGHKVTLFEKEERLGGQLNLAMAPPYKRERLEPLVTYFVTQLGKLKVDVRLRTEASVEALSSLAPDVVILATGALPLIPHLPGTELSNVVTAFDILSERFEAGRRAVVIGGGSTGCETAEFLLEKGKKVTVVEMLPDLAVDMGFRDRFRLTSRITQLPITFITSAKCRTIQEGGVVITRANKEEVVEADTVVLAVGSKPNNSFFPSLRAAGFDTCLAGDCWHIGRIARAISDGLRLGLVL